MYSLCMQVTVTCSSDIGNSTASETNDQCNGAFCCCICVSNFVPAELKLMLSAVSAKRHLKAFLFDVVCNYECLS